MTPKSLALVSTVAIVAASAWGWSAHATDSPTSPRPAPNGTATSAAPKLKLPALAPAPDLPAQPGRHAMHAQAATATNVICGATLTASITLNGDLTCSGTASGFALRITKASVVLNLGGHTIQNSDSDFTGYGVLVAANSDTVENGIITGFDDGVKINGNENGPAATSTKVTALRATYDRYGINDGGSKTSLTSNIVYGNEYGVIQFGADSTVNGNIATGNTYDGLYLQGPGTTISNNQADGNGVDGISVNVVTAHDLIKDNVANFNQGDGIVNVSRDTIDGGGDLAKGNGYGSGQIPEQCYDVACS
jgi:parallel beta-helix repeat protein